MNKDKYKNKLMADIDNVKVKNNDKTEIKEKIKQHKVKINYIEDNSLVFNLNELPKRIKLDLSEKELEIIKSNKKLYKNKELTIYYKGDIYDTFNVDILPLTKLSDIN